MNSCGDCGSAKKLSRMRAARHQVVARAFRRRLGQHRRFDVDEAIVVEERAHRARHLVTQTQALLHHIATQIDVAILQTQLFVRRFVVMERRCLGAVQNFEFVRQQLDLTRGEVRVGGAGRTRAHLAGDADTELAAQALGVREDVLAIGIEHDLQQTFAIAQVDEDDAAMIAAAMDPASDADFLADEGFVDLTAVVGTHGKKGSGYWALGAGQSRKTSGRLPRKGSDCRLSADRFLARAQRPVPGARL